MKGSPAALAGLRFGDQILQINGTIVAGFSMDQVHSLIHKSPVNGISVVVRDRFVLLNIFIWRHVIPIIISRSFFDALLQKKSELDFVMCVMFLCVTHLQLQNSFH
jgi:membrane-associated protease RseP (regulator of RpoE activity)